MDPKYDELQPENTSTLGAGELEPEDTLIEAASSDYEYAIGADNPYIIACMMR